MTYKNFKVNSLSKEKSSDKIIKSGSLFNIKNQNLSKNSDVNKNTFFCPPKTSFSKFGENEIPKDRKQFYAQDLTNTNTVSGFIVNKPTVPSRVGSLEKI